MSSKETFELATKNIKVRTEDSPASGGVGNYQFTYEIISVPGRRENNLYMRDNEGVEDITGSIVLSDYVAMGVPSRARNEAVMATRFSGPGGPETLGVGSRDLESDEYSPYNALPWRNQSVILPLNTLYTSHQDRSGSHGEYGASIASFHKIHRNTRYAIYKGADEVPYTKSLHDNAWIQHAIPYDLGTGTLTYTQEADTQRVAHTGSKARSVLITQTSSSYVLKKSSMEISSSLENLRNLRRANQFSIPIIKTRKDNIGTDNPQFLYKEPPISNASPLLSSIRLTDDQSLKVKSTFAKKFFAKKELNNAYVSKELEKDECLLESFNKIKKKTEHSINVQLYPKPEACYLTRNRIRVNGELDD